MSLINLIEEHEHGFLKIKKRFYYLKKIQQELETTTKGKMYLIRGDVVNHMLKDSYYMLVIDLASIGRGMIKKGGFFRKLRNFLPDLKTPNLSDVQASMKNGQNSGDSFLANSVLRYVQESFKRVFPEADSQKRTQANVDDIEKLKNHFYDLFQEVIHDRDRNRAHRFEKTEEKKESVPFLNLNQLEQKFLEIEKILNDIRMICTFSQYSSNDVSFSNSTRMAQTIVDIILLGDRDLIDNCFGINKDLFNGIGKYTYMYRKDYWNRSHCHQELQTQRVHCNALNDYYKYGDYQQLANAIKTVPLNFEILLEK